MAQKLNTLKAALIPLIFSIIAGCSQGDSNAPETAKPEEKLAPPEETGVLEVATRNGSTTYYLDRHETRQALNTA